MPSSIATSRTAAAPLTTRTLARATRRATRAAEASVDGASLPASCTPQDERLLRLRDVLTVVGLSRAHVYHLVKNGLFPRPIALGSNCARWVQSEVQAWVADRIGRARDTDSAIRRL